jgi:peroxiredoxin
MNRRNFIRRALSAAAALPLASNRLLAQTAAPAAPAPDLAGVDENGRPVKLADYAGKALLVSFFTSGCNLCVNDLKLMREFNRDNRAKSFVMLAVSLDEQQSDYMDYARLIALSVPAASRFPMLWRKAPGHHDTFGPIGTMPTHFVLDKNHQIAFTRKGSFKPDDWDQLWILLG